MSFFSEIHGGTGVTLLMDTQGEAVTYTPKGLAAVSLTGLVGDEKLQRNRPERGTTQVRERQITITRNPSSTYGGVAEVQLNAKVTYGGLDYSVKGLGDSPAWGWRLLLERTLAQEIARPEYRARN